eukprot:NODE_1864_length_1195_cov_78.044944_g1848_i0.p1 GENE.NODE_1864_length_1195_cov_78.044944_g1848_i0~~NODE_1864_length_1195_cov_78.044944_g1848_i0.p1  ORF type:complete len:356 (-),score=96.57 NODE_1864_length_1195_cov_78.044944_g1848_i0:128-1138(-)
MNRLDADKSGALDFAEFTEFLNDITKSVGPKMFDNLIKFLYVAIADFSKDQEADRREKLLRELFAAWDYDESGTIDQKELYTVLTRFNDMERDGGEDHFVTLMVAGSDADGDGVLDPDEFVLFWDDMTYMFKPEEFDFMMYRLHRCLEEVAVLLHGNTKSVQYKQVLLNALEGYEIDELMKDSSPYTPLLCYGTACDPSRAIEAAAKSRGQRVKAFLVTHERGEQVAHAGIQQWGYRAGYWVLLVLGKNYDCDGFLRQVGVTLQTNDTANPRFRLWVWAPYPDIKDFPGIVTCNAHMESLDEIDPEDQVLTKEEVEAKRQAQLGAAAGRNLTAFPE